VTPSPGRSLALPDILSTVPFPPGPRVARFPSPALPHQLCGHPGPLAASLASPPYPCERRQLPCSHSPGSLIPSLFRSSAPLPVVVDEVPLDEEPLDEEPLDEEPLDEHATACVGWLCAGRCLTRFVVQQLGEGAAAPWSDIERAADADSDGTLSLREAQESVQRLAPVFASAHGEVGVRIVVLDSRCLGVLS